MAILQVGDTAPAIEATTSSGKAFRLADYAGKQQVLLVFYPKDETPVCTEQLCNVQDNLGAVRQAGIEPFGVNPGSAESHEQFRSRFNMAFELLVDEGSVAAEAYGAVKPEGGILRSVFVVGRNGSIIYAAEGKPDVTEIMADVAKVQDEPAS